MITVRAVERTDVNAVVELVRTTLAEFGIQFGVGADTDAQLSHLPESYTSDGGAFFVALDDDTLIGTAGIALVEPGVFELRKMYLRARARAGRVPANDSSTPAWSTRSVPAENASCSTPPSR